MQHQGFAGHMSSCTGAAVPVIPLHSIRSRGTDVSTVILLKAVLVKLVPSQHKLHAASL